MRSKSAKARTVREWFHARGFFRHSIRHRIMVIFIGLMAAMLLAIWAINNWWLERYYIDQKLEAMEAAYGELNAVVLEKTGDGENIGSVIEQEAQEEKEKWRGSAAGTGQAGSGDSHTLLGTIRSYREQNNINTVMIDSLTGDALTVGMDSDFLAQKVQRYVLGMGGDHSKLLKEDDNYTVEISYDGRTKSSYMESWGFFSDNRTLFIMSMPLASIRESVVLANRFTTFVGLVALALGSILMYFVTNRVTKPLMRLVDVSGQMSNLNFDVSYQDDAQDEIGILGRSMNTLSETLKETIGALRDANAQLQHDIDEKTQIDEMRKDFIANVSHELKTPIALIQGYAEGLNEGMCEDEESRSYYCEVIVDEAGKMNKMVKQLLTLTALEFGKDAPVMEPFDLSELIADLMNSSSILIQQNEAHVECSVPEALWVRGDEFRIEEVLTNYLTNAMNHLGGSRVIRIRAEQQGQTVTVRVFNTGEPIPQEDLPNLWTKFYKVDKARTRAYGGSGIGLSIVKAVMDAHHQACGVENKEDGVEFWFTLDACGEPEAEEHAVEEHAVEGHTVEGHTVEGYAAEGHAAEDEAEAPAEKNNPN